MYLPVLGIEPTSSVPRCYPLGLAVSIVNKEVNKIVLQKLVFKYVFYFLFYYFRGYVWKWTMCTDLEDNRLKIQLTIFLK